MWKVDTINGWQQQGIVDLLLNYKGLFTYFNISNNTSSLIPSSLGAQIVFLKNECIHFDSAIHCLSLWSNAHRVRLCNVEQTQSVEKKYWHTYDVRLRTTIRVWILTHLTCLGLSGHYYCGLRVLNCACCDGICGPQRGCNCIPCQQLDQEEVYRTQTYRPPTSALLLEKWEWANTHCKYLAKFYIL